MEASAFATVATAAERDGKAIDYMHKCKRDRQRERRAEKGCEHNRNRDSSVVGGGWGARVVTCTCSFSSINMDLS